MKIVIVKKGTKRWIPSSRESSGANCCTVVEGTYYACFEVAAA